MQTIGSGVLVAIALVLAIPVAVLALECAIAVLSAPRAVPETTARAPEDVVVMIPAHDEAAGIGATLASLLPHLSDPQQAIVIADNCSDNTAEVARAAGVRVWEREDRERRGKGYALDFGLQQLAAAPPAVVIFVDADCLLAPGAIATLARRTQTEQQPFQARYLLSPPEEPSPKTAVSSLAFLVKNCVRPLGLARLGLPCLIVGSGMAFPWAALAQISLASGNIVEDMQLGIDVAIAGYSPQFAWEALVLGALPSQDTTATGQRRRWEHGHLSLILAEVPKLLGAAVRQGRFELVALALELAVPPLSLLVLLWLGATVLAAAFAVWGSWVPLACSGAVGVVLVGSVAIAWARFGRELVPLRQLLSIPGYVLWKIPLYLGFFGKRETEWVRTERES